ncbi:MULTISPECIES: hypothetical protein [Halobacterium]|uniref:Uncharacterized protein n=4 Tax=Halobacterium salinarum TaxID=2242 RepID=Q9HPA1_HALSA|nr:MULTISPECIES: hypothetical protein [Halobacterium]AAG19969.1 hypothetical protein VNG_1734H [Halobacterium salinarum NRC-1]MBB6088976.1 hypothetical protein [Halobacterium salinarum]MCF2164807.1 hypothetical protein [Halobacterium salinarum]MCF2168568.1 hypothetical protein [Halobacterium salinarum]MCF2206207.1 hypothetical protein [Halobacterium salinarum]
MMGILEVLDPPKAVLPLIALIGLVPVVARYRTESRWFVVGYGLLAVATLATNLENIVLGDVLNGTEHALGLMGSGIAFLVAGYYRRQTILDPQSDDAATGDAAPAAEGDDQ